MIKAIFFDFDGVIVDSDGQVKQALVDVIEHAGLSMPSQQEWDQILGLTGVQAINHIFKNPSEEKFMTQFNYYRERLILRRQGIVLWPGSIEFVAKIHAKYQTALVTNRYRESLGWLLEKFNLSSHFDVIIAGDEVKNPKPSPDGILEGMERLSLTSGQVIYVGDRSHDEDAAHAAGVKFVLFRGTMSVLDDVL